MIKDKYGYKGQLKQRALQCRTEPEPDATQLIFTNQIYKSNVVTGTFTQCDLKKHMVMYTPGLP